jgi:tetratricopeptide (TPR) repeat protein
MRTVDQLLETALEHFAQQEESEGRRLLQEILTQQPSHGLARLWLGYYTLHHFMHPKFQPPVIRSLQDLAKECRRNAAAAYSLLSQFLRRDEDSSGSPRELLELSILLEPEWPLTRVLLADLYEEAGDFESARKQLEEAARLLRGDEAASMSFVEREFEYSFTGRISAYLKEAIPEKLAALDERQQGV